jgi:beta-glucanase (GH16 family)
LGVVAVFAAGPATATPAQSAKSTQVAGRFVPSSSPTCGGLRPAKPGGGIYTCTFTDDFNDAKLDSSKWAPALTAENGFSQGRECYVGGPNNISVSGGSLHLTSQVEATSFTCKSPYGDFTTSQTAASVLSTGRFSQTYGRFEFRAKFPSTTIPGVDSALWMYPESPAYGAWPNSGEIDVAERFGSTYGDHVFPSLHYAGLGTTLATGLNCVVPNSTSTFRTYAVAWTPTTMYFYYNNQLCYQHSWTPAAPLTAPQPFDKAFDLVMTQTGGMNAPAGTSMTMDIDWVRAWK